MEDYVSKLREFSKLDFQSKQEIIIKGRPTPELGNMQSSSESAVEEISMSSSLDVADEVEVWHQVLMEYQTEELTSFKSALGAFRQDLQHNLDGLRAEMSLEVQAMRDGLSTRLQALECKGGELDEADALPLLQDQTPVDPGASSSSPPPASPQPLAVGAPPLQTGPSAGMVEIFRALASLQEDTLEAPMQEAATTPPLASSSASWSSQLNSSGTTPPPCTSKAKAAANLDDLEPALASALEPHMPTCLAPQDKL